MTSSYIMKVISLPMAVFRALRECIEIERQDARDSRDGRHIV